MVRSEHPLTSQSLRPEGNTGLERFLPCNCLFFWFYLSTSTKFHSNSFFPLWSVVAQCLVLQVKLFCLSLHPKASSPGAACTGGISDSVLSCCPRGQDSLCPSKHTKGAQGCRCLGVTLDKRSSCASSHCQGGHTGV